MIINKIEVGELDIYDADVMEKIEKSLVRVQEEANKSVNLKASDSIRMQCNAVFDCFNDLFGKGTDKKVFGDKVNLLICLTAFEELVKYIEEQKMQLAKMASKYSSNRASRRK